MTKLEIRNSKLGFAHIALELKSCGGVEKLRARW